MDPSPTTTSPLPPPITSPSASSPSFPFPTTDDDDTVRRPPRPATLAGACTDMSRPVGRVGSDLSHSNYSTTATNHGALHHQSTINSNSISANKARQRLSLLFSGVGTWRRSGSGRTIGGAESKKRQAKGNSKREGLDIGQLVKKYMSMVEQLFTSFSSGGSKRERRELRRRPHSFTSGRGWNGPSKRDRGRLSSAPASLRGSPANSGHLSVVGSVTTKVSTSSEESTMEELQSAIQAAIAHCKNSNAVAKQAGGDKCKC